MIKFLPKVILFFELLFAIHCKHIANGTSKDVYVFCDRSPSLVNSSAADRQNVCKVECYTKLKNPGFCQTSATPCQALDASFDAVKCRRGSGQSSQICCPFRPESSANTIDDNRQFECGKRPTIQAIVGGMSSSKRTNPYLSYSNAIPQASTPSPTPGPGWQRFTRGRVREVNPDSYAADP